MIKNIKMRLARMIASANAFDKQAARFAENEQIRVRQHQCRANMPAAASKGQGLYEAKHGRHAMPFENQPAHIRESYEQVAMSGESGYNFRGNNSAYKRFFS